MSIGSRLTFEDAYELGQEALEQLWPVLEDLKAVGSLRRERTTIGDIEFLARPHSSPDLFGGPTTIHHREVRDAMHHLGTWVKGGSRMMQITDLLGRTGTRLELYLVHPPGCKCFDCPHGPAAWGSMLAIRTGPAELGRYCVTRMRARGYRHEHGHASQLATGESVPTETEEAFFELAGVPCLASRLRDDQSVALWKAYSHRQKRGMTDE